MSSLEASNDYAVKIVNNVFDGVQYLLWNTLDVWYVLKNAGCERNEKNPSSGSIYTLA